VERSCQQARELLGNKAVLLKRVRILKEEEAQHRRADQSERKTSFYKPQVVQTLILGTFDQSPPRCSLALKVVT
jgi:hypothetical protein